MTSHRTSRAAIALTALFLAGACASGAALAQSTLPPGSVPGADSGDSATLVVQVNRLEDELRAANGRIEELQNQQQRLQDQLKRFQQDVEFRFDHPGSGGGAGASIAPAPAPMASVPPAPAPVGAEPIAPAKRSDAFNPAVDPSAPGAPEQLGTTRPSAPLGAPLDLSHPAAANAAPGDAVASAEQPKVIPGISAVQPDSARAQFDAALASFRAGQYQQAEGQFRAFLARNTASRLVPDATFYLGESYLQRSRPREAAEQYLKLSTDYAHSSRAPEGMLRLGESLAMLGNAQQACATFGEVGRRYPTASSGVKRGVEREMQKDHC